MNKKIALLASLIFIVLIGGILITDAQREVELPSARLTPDSMFYFLKPASEGVGTFFKFGDLSKAERYSELALRRTAEAKKLIEMESELNLVEKTTERQKEQLEESLSRARSAADKGKDISQVTEAIERSAHGHVITMEEAFTLAEEHRDTALQSRDNAQRKQIEALELLAEKNPQRATEISAEVAQDRLERMKRYAEEDEDTEDERRTQRAMKDYGAFLDSFDGMVQGEEALVDYLIDTMGEQAQAFEEAQIFMDHLSPEASAQFREIRRGLSETALSLESIKEITDVPQFEDFDDLDFSDLDMGGIGIPPELADFIAEEMKDVEVGRPSVPMRDEEEEIEMFVEETLEIFREFDEFHELVEDEEKAKEDLRNLAKEQLGRGQELERNLEIMREKTQELSREEILEIIEFFIEEGKAHPLITGEEPVIDDETEEEAEEETETEEAVTGETEEEQINVFVAEMFEMIETIDQFDEFVEDEEEFKEGLYKLAEMDMEEGRDLERTLSDLKRSFEVMSDEEKTQALQSIIRTIEEEVWDSGY